MSKVIFKEGSTVRLIRDLVCRNGETLPCYLIGEIAENTDPNCADIENITFGGRIYTIPSDALELVNDYIKDVRVKILHAVIESSEKSCTGQIIVRLPNNNTEHFDEVDLEII